MSYNIRVEVADDMKEDVYGFLEAYRRLLQKTIDEIWANIRWDDSNSPVIPMDNGFKRYLRSSLLSEWRYAAHYVDSAIKQAFAIMKGWRRNYING